MLEGEKIGRQRMIRWKEEHGWKDEGKYKDREIGEEDA